MCKKLLSPSLLSADLCDVKGAVTFIEKHGGSSIHVDVMDGHFVPEITYGESVIRALKKITKLPLDVHLMTKNAEDRVDSFIDAGSDCVTFHIEAVSHAHRLATHIRERGKLAGVAINPATPVCMIEELLPYVDIVLVMGVNPGYAGQKFIPSVLKKVRQLSSLKSDLKSEISKTVTSAKKWLEPSNIFSISIDGGINSSTAPAALKAGCDILVSGSAFFKRELQWEKV